MFKTQSILVSFLLVSTIACAPERDFSRVDVYNGVKISLLQFPAVVAIAIRHDADSTNKSRGMQSGSGSAIGPSTLLTAAHVVSSDTIDRHNKVIPLFINGQALRGKILINPFYDHKATKLPNNASPVDVALIVFERPIFQKQLAIAAQQLVVGDYAKMVGFGMYLENFEGVTTAEDLKNLEKIVRQKALGFASFGFYGPEVEDAYHAGLYVFESSERAPLPPQELLASLPNTRRSSSVLPGDSGGPLLDANDAIVAVAHKVGIHSDQQGGKIVQSMFADIAHPANKVFFLASINDGADLPAVCCVCTSIQTVSEKGQTLSSRMKQTLAMRMITGVNDITEQIKEAKCVENSEVRSQVATMAGKAVMVHMQTTCQLNFMMAPCADAAATSLIQAKQQYNAQQSGQATSAINSLNLLPLTMPNGRPNSNIRVY